MLITVLAQILVRYNEILETNPELRLSSALPAKRLSEILMGRLIPFISSQQNVEVAHDLRIRLYDFAMALMQAGRDRDALACLLASRPSIKEDHEFWICACLFNVAQTSKNPEDVKAAAEHAEQIVSGTIKVPDKYVQGVKQMLSQLKPPGTQDENLDGELSAALSASETAIGEDIGNVRRFSGTELMPNSIPLPYPVSQAMICFQREGAEPDNVLECCRAVLEEKTSVRIFSNMDVYFVATGNRKIPDGDQAGMNAVALMKMNEMSHNRSYGMDNFSYFAHVDSKGHRWCISACYQ